MLSRVQTPAATVVIGGCALLTILIVTTRATSLTTAMPSTISSTVRKMGLCQLCQFHFNEIDYNPCVSRRQMHNLQGMSFALQNSVSRLLACDLCACNLILVSNQIYGKYKKSDLYVVIKIKELTKYVITVTEKSPKKFRFTLVTRTNVLHCSSKQAFSLRP